MARGAAPPRPRTLPHHAQAIIRVGDRYRLDPQHVEVDLWQFTAALDHAATTIDPTEHTTILHKVIALGTGPIADGYSWLWLAPHRETARRQILDAYVALANTAADPRVALDLIQEAIRIDPYNEDVYQRAMRLHAALASPDGVRRTLRTLTQRLGELEVHVSPQTQHVATDLLGILNVRTRNEPDTS